MGGDRAFESYRSWEGRRGGEQAGRLFDGWTCETRGVRGGGEQEGRRGGEQAGRLFYGWTCETRGVREGWGTGGPPVLRLDL